MVARAFGGQGQGIMRLRLEQYSEKKICLKTKIKPKSKHPKSKIWTSGPIAVLAELRSSSFLRMHLRTSLAEKPGLLEQMQMSAVWLCTMSLTPQVCFLTLSENAPCPTGLSSGFDEVEHVELCAQCLLAYVIFSEGLATRRKCHPIHFVGHGSWWDRCLLFACLYVHHACACRGQKKHRISWDWSCRWF